MARHVAQKVLVIHWTDFERVLPTGGDLLSQNKRRLLYDSFDTKGNGIIPMRVAIRQIYRLLPTIAGITDSRPLLSRAFKSTVETIQPVASIGADNIDRNQFRCLLKYIYWYLKIWELLCQHPLEVKEHVSLNEFEATIMWLCDWGFQAARNWSSDPEESWDRLSGDTGLVPVEEFIDHCVRGDLVNLTSADEDNERALATRLLQRTFPHLIERNEEQGKHQSANYSHKMVAPVPPPGQKVPCALIRNEQELNHHPFNRWSTSYMCQFESPSKAGSRGPSACNSVANSLAPSRASQSRASQSPSRASAAPSRGIQQFQGRALSGVGSTIGTPSGSTRGGMPPRGHSIVTQSAPCLQPSGYSLVPNKRGYMTPGMAERLGTLPEGSAFINTPTGKKANPRETFSGMEKTELRQKLEMHMEMSSTNGMRSLLKAAGGIVMKPTGKLERIRSYAAS